MANYGYCTFPKNMEIGDIDSRFHDVNKSFFEGLFVIDFNMKDYWVISLPNYDLFRFDIFVKSKRKLEWPNRGGDIVSWVRDQFICRMATPLKGMISDDGISGKWNPDFHVKYPYIRDWIKPHNPVPFSLLFYVLKFEKKRIPEPLLKFWK